MKWSFVIQQKIKAALLLGCIMLLIVFNSLLSRSNIRGIDESVTSIYQDRLIPAIDIIYLTEGLYSKRLLLEKYLLSATETNALAVRDKLSAYNRSIDSLLEAYAKTYLVEQETKSFTALRNRVAEYGLLEQTILNFSDAGFKDQGIELFEGKGSDVFQHTIVRLNELTAIQSVVGKELRAASQTEASRFAMHSTFLIIIAIVIGALILNLIYSSKIIQREPKKFHLN